MAHELISWHAKDSYLRLSDYWELVALDLYNLTNHMHFDLGKIFRVMKSKIVFTASISGTNITCIAKIIESAGMASIKG